MSINRTVFGSRPERANYYKLRRAWGSTYNVYHNLPFLNVFSISDMNLSGIEKSRIKKTSIDFTLCDANDSPLICIEFDGLYDGVNIGAGYHPAREPDSDWRQQICSLKLRVAHASSFPFFIVGSDQFKDISPGLKLTVVDGLVGAVLAQMAAHSRFQQGFDCEEVGWDREAFEKLGPGTRQEIIQDWVIDVETIAELRNNPVVALAARLSCELGAVAASEFIHFPEIDECPYIGDPDFIKKFEARIKQIEAALYVGRKVTVRASDDREVSRTVMLPHFKVPGFHIENGLAGDIAELLCLDTLRRPRPGA